MEFCSNWLRLITLCENVTLFWSCGPDCLLDSYITWPLFSCMITGLIFKDTAIKDKIISNAECCNQFIIEGTPLIHVELLLF